MLDAINFVYAATGDKDGAEVLRIKHKFVQAFNGSIAMCSPIAMNIDCQPNAKLLRTVLKQYSEAVVQLTMTEAGKLRVKAGSFKSMIPCAEETLPIAMLPQQRLEIDPLLLLSAFSKLLPFICTDTKPNREWANGIILKDGQAFATNNAVLVNLWLGCNFPSVHIIPKKFVDAALSVKEPPFEVRLSNSSIAFIYGSGRWLYGNLISGIPFDFNTILDTTSAPIRLPEGFYETLDALLPFKNSSGDVFFKNDFVCTEDDIEAGSSIELFGVKETWGRYNIDFIMSLKDIIDVIDFSSYPRPSLFFGNNLRGAIIGKKI